MHVRLKEPPLELFSVKFELYAATSFGNMGQNGCVFHVTKTCRHIFDQKSSLKSELYNMLCQAYNLSKLIRQLVGYHHTNFYMYSALFENSTVFFLKMVRVSRNVFHVTLWQVQFMGH